MAVEVIGVSTPKEMQVFNAFPRKLYGDFYRAPLFPVIDKSSPRGDPLFSRVEAQPFLAIRNGYAVGRIAAGLHQSLAGEAGFFGFFESPDDPAIAAALFKEAARWLAARGAKKMIGPVDLSPHERLGLLVKGFGGPPRPGMPYNPPYYSKLLEQCGLETEISLRAYHFDLRRPWPDRLFRVAARAGRNPEFRIRRIDFNDPAGEGEVFSLIHNSSMGEIWGFVPLSPEEASSIWLKLRRGVDPDLILVAEFAGKPAGLCLALNPVSRAPFLPVRSNARLAVLAVLPQYRFKGLEAALILECARRALRKGTADMELSLVAENNTMMNKIIQSMEGVKISRVYKVYKKYLTN